MKGMGGGRLLGVRRNASAAMTLLGSALGMSFLLAALGGTDAPILNKWERSGLFRLDSRLRTPRFSGG